LKMRALICARASLVTAVLCLLGCQTQVEPRVVRLALNLDGSTWRLAVDASGQGNALSSSRLTNELTRLRLRWGDALLLDSPPSPQRHPAKEAEKWLFGYCQSNRVAVNLIHGYVGVDMFSVLAYHWTAPYQNPFDLANAAFFREGKLLGRGTNGFAQMLHQITRQRPRQVFILGSLYDMDGSFPPGSSPYENERDQLYDALRASGTDFIMLDPLP